MIVSLDAEKAFDSIQHWYIKEILKKIGLTDFIPTFDLLYKNQSVDIIVNGTCSGKYRIKNGVKQGDALSCILFILGIEPLIRNIEMDESITRLDLNSQALIPES
jgi:Reverse transcriptase (RNA-dependent DNA polymerase).